MLYPFSRLRCLAHSPTNCGLAVRKKRGFNLIEAAIVLCVVGLVIGGIWVAAAAVNDHFKWQRTEEGWLYYLELINQNFTVQSADATRAAGSSDIDLSFLNKFQPPAGWVIKYHPCCGSLATDPYGNPLFVQLQSNGVFSFGYYHTPPVSKSLCIKIERMVISRIAPIYPITYASPNAACARDVSACCTGGVQRIQPWLKLLHPN